MSRSLFLVLILTLCSTAALAAPSLNRMETIQLRNWFSENDQEVLPELLHGATNLDGAANLDMKVKRVAQKLRAGLGGINFARSQEIRAALDEIIARADSPHFLMAGEDDLEIGLVGFLKAHVESSSARLEADPALCSGMKRLLEVQKGFGAVTLPCGGIGLKKASHAPILDEFRVHFIELPEVTEADVAHLAQVETSITAPMPAFKIADRVTPIGLYKAVMGHYPQYADEITKARWVEDPSLPLTFTKIAEDVAFAAELSRLTGRQFRIPSTSELEYSIRGRTQGLQGGLITTTAYPFGDDPGQVAHHAWIRSNSENRPHGVAEVPEGADPENFKNSFGLIHPIGNIWQRSRQGVIRGGAFGNLPQQAALSFRIDGANLYYETISSRLAEDL